MSNPVTNEELCPFDDAKISEIEEAFEKEVSRLESLGVIFPVEDIEITMTWSV